MKLGLSALCLLLSFAAVAQTSALTPESVAELQARGYTVKVNTERYFTLELAAIAVPPAEFLRTHVTILGAAAGTKFVPGTGTRAVDGARYIRFGQRLNNADVIGGEVSLRLDGRGFPRTISGYLAPADAFSSLALFSAPAAAPVFSEAALIDAGRAHLTTQYPTIADWQVEPKDVVWISANPWSKTEKRHRTQAIEFTEPGGFRGTMVYVDVLTGKPIFDHQLHCDLDRQLYSTTTDPTNLIWEEGQAFPGNLNAEGQEMLTATGEVYHLYHRTFGRNSYDDADGVMRTLTDRQDACPNASASGDLIRHCPGTVTDDIVAHEWTHNYTGAMGNPIYQYETGAIDEGLADIFGEAIDLLNDRGNDFNDDRMRTRCDNNSQRWRLGEDAAVFGGALRDMYNPECEGDPSSRSSSSFSCDPFIDNGGVHINSGVVNRSFSLLVDGGTLNGTTVNGIGLTKALHIYFHANENYLGRVTDFRAFADMLLQSTEDLYGTDLPSLTLIDLPAAPSGLILTAADRAEVENALTATGMLTPNACPSTPTLAQNPPASCGSNPENQERIHLNEDWENGLGPWTLNQNPSNPATWTDQPWVILDNLPDGRAGTGVYAADPAIGDCVDDLENGSTAITSPIIELPADAALMELRFNHYYATERNYDGGVLQYSRNNSSFQLVPIQAFIYNGYDGALIGPGSNDNPFAGRQAFHGSDSGRNTGTWGTSVVDLDYFANPGDDLRLRWTMTFDGCNGTLGWYLDEVTVSSCVAAALPVIWSEVSAEAKKDDILVKWTTTEETDNVGFTVERTDNGKPFTAIGTVAPTTETTGEYGFVDEALVPGTNYTYRIAQRDFDGSISYSPLVSAVLSGKVEGIAAFPNPATDRLTIKAADGLPVYLLGSDGRLISKTIIKGGSASLQVADLPAGVYFLRQGSESLKVVIGN
ncbi:M4 family metallopeptidase [Lewinella sp. 4G2]|uniref:M4 family metallopeptidase n=1 Tax=Lewinella sp. 4G2 TaxID=1803372 RepID=UPI0007B4DCD7|nr:M4 family metallopeptidase [Lewinella sp. 4G2]OAV44682.1 hypothetical protein A3850_009350 [Lewinella sp. 4G2]